MIRTTLVAALATLVCPLSAQVLDLYDMNTVRDVYLTFSQANYWSQLTANYGPEINIAADMTIEGVTYPNVGVRFRGNTSYTQLPAQPNQGWEKKSFNIETDWMIAGQDVAGISHLNFNNGFHDPTFMREALTYYVMRRHGVAPRANWIRLHLNGTYWGVYINVEQPNKDMMKEWFRSNDGNRYRCFPTSGSFSNGRCCYTVLSPNVASSYLAAYQAKQGDGTDLMNMCTVLGAMTTATPQTTLTNVFSVDAFYRYAAVMVTMMNTDSYLSSGKDHYLYIDEVHGDGTTFPFDLNESMAGTTQLASNTQVTNTFRPGFTKTLIFTDWVNRYKAHQRAVIDNTLNPTHLHPLINQWYTMLTPHVLADTKKIYSTTLFQQNLNSTVTASGVSLQGLLPFVTNRYNHYLTSTTDTYTQQVRPTLTNLLHSPSSPTPNQSIQFTVQATGAASVNLYWRRIGEFLKAPMFDDGLHGDGAAADGTWGVSIPGQQPGALVDYYAEGIASGGGARYLPYTAECERYCPKVQIAWPVVSSPITINEILAQNINGAVDENAQHEDWVELYNTSNQTVDVSGMWLSDSLVVLKYQFPAGSTIPANGVIRVWADEDGTQGPLHANFKLSSTGETVALYDNTGLALVEYVTFGPQQADVSTGRLNDGGGPWVTLPAPTHLARNELAGCGQRTFGGQLATVHQSDLAVTGTLQQGTTATYAITNGPVSGIGVGALAFGAGHTDLGGIGIGNETLLLDPLGTTLWAAVLLDGTGAGNWTFAIPGGAAGLRLYAQSFTLDASGWDSTRAIEATICP
ncbi:MAG: CotH kinase family protein [Planctomycetes bacterium]|nr:CotH kinase family protein [Planctomycetota bacterium]